MENRLFQSTVVLERHVGLNNDVQVEPGLWSTATIEEARGLAVSTIMSKWPGYAVAAQSVTDITDTTRTWVRLNPAENGPSNGGSTSATKAGSGTDQNP